MADILIPVSLGELFDKISILEIKAENIKEKVKLANVKYELARLNSVSKVINLPDENQVFQLREQLKAVNKRLWDSEDEIRDLEQSRDFSDAFIQVARGIYRLNDERAAVKRKINVIGGSEIVEEKNYKEY